MTQLLPGDGVGNPARRKINEMMDRVEDALLVLADPPQGEQGEQGEKGEDGEDGQDGQDGANFSVDAVGLLAARSTHDAEPDGFAFLATDTGDLYIRQGETAGVWSDAIPFRGPAGPGATWESLPDKPATFPPEDHSHPPPDWDDIPNKPSTFTPAGHSQAASTITDFAVESDARIAAQKQASSLDTATGKLLAMTPSGVFGLGSTAGPTLLTDVDVFNLPIGWYRTSSVNTVAGTLPLTTAKNGLLLAERYSATSEAQVWRGATVNRTFRRIRTAGGAWQAWEDQGAGDPIFPSVSDWGMVGDGTTDWTTQLTAIVAFCTSTGRSVFVPPGTYLHGSIAVAGNTLSLYGDRNARATFLLKPGANSNSFGTTGDGRLVLTDLIIDHNGTHQSGGHGLRSGGCTQFHITRVKILNARSYGIGLQAGRMRGVVLTDVEVDGAGSDGIDIKDHGGVISPEAGNETIVIDGYTFRNIGNGINGDLEGAAQDCGLDLRGPVQVRRVRGWIEGSHGGVRQRFADFDSDSTPNGPGATGTLSDVEIWGVPVDGVYSTATVAVSITGEKGFVVNGVYAKNVGCVVKQDSTSTRAMVSNFVGEDLRGDGLSVAGTDGTFANFDLENHASAPRIVDVEASAVRALLTGFRVTDNSAEASPFRVSAGALNTRLSNGIVRGGAVGDAGTGTVQTNVSAL